MDINTLVPTPDGWKTMGALKAGDWVFGDDGQPCRVVEAYAVMEDRPCVEVTFDDGTVIVTDEEHEWLTQTATERKNSRRKKIDGKETKVTAGELVTQRKHGRRTSKEIGDTLMVYGSSRTPMANHSVLNPLPVQYGYQMLAVDPYVLGVWLGDGTAVSGTITTEDDEIVRFIEEAGYPVKKYKATYLWRVMPLYDQLKNLGVLGNKHIPEVYLQGSIEQRRALLQGLLDTDGYVDARGHCYFYNTNKTLIDQTCELLASLGIKARVQEGRAKLYGKDCGPKWAVFFKADGTFRLSRKLNRQTKTGVMQEARYVWNVQPVASRPVRCISVDSPSRLFLVSKSYIPTHNSYATAMDAVARAAANAALYGQTKCVYWIVGPDYEQPRKEFEYIHDAFKALGRKIEASTPRAKSSPWWMRIDGIGEWQTKSSGQTGGAMGNVMKLASEALDGVIMAEAAQQTLDVMLKCRGRVAEKRGWVILSGTFESSLGWYASYFTRWQTANPERGKSFSVPTWTNTAIYPGGRNDPEILALEATYPHDLFLERFAAIPCKPATLVFKEFDVATHVREEVTFDPERPVYLAVDPGYAPGAYCVLAIQTGYSEHAEIVFVVDEVYRHEATGPEVIAECKERPWWKNVEGGVMDIAGRAHMAMKSQQEVWRDEANLWLQSSKVPILDGIARHRTFLIDPSTNEPRLLHSPYCTNMIEEYALYRRPTDREGAPVNEIPIDRNNHAMKAIAYFLFNRYGAVERVTRKPTKVPTL